MSTKLRFAAFVGSLSLTAALLSTAAVAQEANKSTF